MEGTRVNKFIREPKKVNEGMNMIKKVIKQDTKFPFVLI